MSTAAQDAANLRRGLRNGLLLAVLFIWAPLASIVLAFVQLARQIF